MPDSKAPHAARSDVERNRRALLSAAAEELDRNPGASMVDIAHAAHLTRATLYRHFGTREKLVDGLQAEALDRATRALAESRLDDGPALEALRRAIESLAVLGGRFRSMLIEGGDLDPRFRDQRVAVLGPLRDVIRRGQDDGEIRSDVPPEWVVRALAAMLAAGVRTVPVGDDSGASLAELVYQTLVTGIRAKSQN